MNRFKIKPWHLRFVQEYVNHGVAKTAYAIARPLCSDKTAEVQGPKLLGRQEIQDAIKQACNNNDATSTSIRQKLTDRALILLDKSEDQGQIGNAVKCIESVAKLQHLYHVEEQDSDKYLQVINKIFINQGVMNVSSKQHEQISDKPLNVLSEVVDDDESGGDDASIYIEGEGDGPEYPDAA